MSTPSSPPSRPFTARALIGLALALALPACESADPPADVTAAGDSSLGASLHEDVMDRIFAAQAEYKILRYIEMQRIREWIGLEELELHDDDLEHRVGALSNMRGTSISYAAGPWNHDLTELHAGAKLGHAYVALDAEPGVMAGFFSISVRGAGNGYVAEWTDELTQEVVRVGPAMVSASLAGAPAAIDWSTITLSLREGLWVYDYHWLYGGIVYGVEVPIPELELHGLVEMAQIYLAPDVGIVAAARSFREVLGEALLEVAAHEQIALQPGFVHADRGASLTVHTALEALPSVEDLAAGAYVAFGVERGTSADVQYVERGHSIDPEFVPPSEPPFEGFYRVFVAGDAVIWEDLDGFERGTSVEAVQIGEPSGAAPRAGGALGVLETRLSLGWDDAGAGITIDAALPR